MSPEEMRKTAHGHRLQADWHVQRAARLVEQAQELETQADLDEANPPTVVEQIDRLLGSI